MAYLVFNANFEVLGNHYFSKQVNRRHHTVLISISRYQKYICQKEFKLFFRLSCVTFSPFLHAADICNGCKMQETAAILAYAIKKWCIAHNKQNNRRCVNVTDSTSITNADNKNYAITDWSGLQLPNHPA